MALPVVCADSVLDRDTVTTSSAAAAGFPLSRLNDDRDFVVFKTASASAVIAIETDAGLGNTSTSDYFALSFHDLFDPASDGLGPVTVTFSHSSDGIGQTTIFIFIVADNKIIFRTYPSVTNRFFRLRLTRGNAFIPSIGEVQWGKRVEFPFGIGVGFDPQAEKIQSRFTRSQSGNILGAVNVFSERNARLDLPLIPNTFVRGSTVGQFQEFWDNHASLMKPFYFHWNPGDPGAFEKDGFFAIILPNTVIDRRLATPLDSGFRDIRFNITGLKEC